MDVRARPATIPLRPTRSEPAESKPSAFPVLVCEKAIPASARRARRRRTRASAAEGEPAADRRDRRHRLPDQDRGPRVPGVQRRRAVAVRRGGRRGGGRRAPISSSTSATTTTARTRARPATPDARAARGATAGMRGRPISSRRRKGCSPAAPWIVVRGNHESCSRAGQGWWRFLDPRPLAPAAGLQRRRRRRDRRLQRAVRGAARVGRRLPTPSSSCSIRRWSASRRCRRTIRCTSSIGGSSSARSRSPRGGRTRSS